MKTESEYAAYMAEYTRELRAEGLAYTLHISVKPETDLDGEFQAFDHYEEEIITVQGWNFVCYDIDDEGE